MKILKSISATLKGVSRSIIAMAMLAFVLVGCQYEEYSPYESKAILRYTILTYQAHTINGSTVGDPTYSWSVKVLSGGDFCQPESNTGRVGQKFYLRIGKNEGDEVRSATIRITFSDGYSNTFSVRQLPETGNPEYDHPWAEQPEYLQNNDYIYKTYYTTLANGDDVRNFSICYDMTKMCSRWVAYPAHTVYTDGRSYDTGGTTAGRTNAWAFDDAVTRYKSSSHYNTSYEITSKYVESIDSYDTYTLPIIPQRRQPDIVYQNGFGWGWARGHMLPSSCRYSTWNTNAQTCYATNIMVQAYDFNGEVWTRVEEKERAEICADTLFVVTGTLFEDDNTINANGRVVGVPSHCYKVFLRTKLGRTGKHIMDITSADELKSIGFLYENSNSETRTPAETAVSVAEIEERAGFKFFQNLNPKIADKVKAQKNLKDWGL